MTNRILLTLGLVLAPWQTVSAQSTTRPRLPPLLSEAEEIALAESAAPESIARAAAVYVLERGGYVLKRPGTNGFTCLVGRSHPMSIEPICFDAAGTESVVPRMLDAAALRASGADSATVAASIAEGYRTGRYRAPGRTGVAYMLSPHTRFHDPATGRTEPGSPHVMVYAPYLRNRDIGSPGEHALPDRSMAFVIEEGTPQAYIILPVGTPAARPDVGGAGAR
ncbi:MAG TPA: hypothetical protein VNK43_06580 [Gemmatimonadales bacterium]|nr:hypothetical protein [Gemmatimonadales bacterium]